MTTSNDAMQTHYCKFPGCTNEAKSRVGRYSYCPEHQGRGPKAKAGSANGMVGKLAALRMLAVACDKAEARADKLTRDALAAKAHVDEARAAFRDALREASA